MFKFKGDWKKTKQRLTYVCRHRIDHVVQWNKACGIKGQKSPVVVSLSMASERARQQRTIVFCTVDSS